MLTQSRQLFAALLLSSACAPTDDPATSVTDTVRVALPAIVHIPESAIDSIADSAGLGGLIELLRTSPGAFSRSPNGMLAFSGDSRLLGSFYRFADSAVFRLVSCLDDTTRVAATYAGQPLPLGVMCGLALQRTAYSRAHEDGDGDWPGVVSPDASIEQLRVAKREWEAVLARKGYVLP